MTKYTSAYNQNGAVTEMYMERKESIVVALTPIFTQLLDDGFSYNDVRGMLLDASFDFVEQQVLRELHNRNI